MMLFKVTLLLGITCISAKALPGNFQAVGGFEANVAPPPLITFDKGGNFGVNFGGYHASAGLGGLLSGNLARGGLHAEAGTPFGQEAAAGLGGGVSGSGILGGGLFAGATAGGGVKASAGLAGESNASGAAVFEEERLPGKVVVAEKHIKGTPEVQRTIIEKTVIPNYVEKKVQETHYVEKTVRVPQTIEKTVRVPVAPTVIEKHIEVAPEHQQKGTIALDEDMDVRTRTGTIVETKPASAVAVSQYGSTGGGFSASSGAGIFTRGGFSGSSGIDGGLHYRKTVSPTLFTDIFNIPISTLGAVRNLLNGFAGGVSASGSVGVNKYISAY